MQLLSMFINKSESDNESSVTAIFTYTKQLLFGLLQHNLIDYEGGKITWVISFSYKINVHPHLSFYS